jgi:outer membrane protein OmpA-like peptidoglycan-associated protein
MLKHSIVILILLLFSITIHAQNKALCPPSSNKKANKYLDDAKDAKKSREPYTKIKESILKSLAEDSTFGDAYKFLGDVAFSAHKDDEMSSAYRKFIELCPDASSDVYYKLGNYYYATRDYKNAIETLQSFLDFNKVKEENGKDASQKIAKAKIMMHPVPFNPVPLTNVSSGDPEYLAVISPDQDLCFFTRRYEESKKGTLFNSNVEKFMISTKVNGVFSKGEAMPPPFNKALNGNEGGASISIDNKHLFFTVNKAGNFDIYTSDEVNGKWTEPVSVGPEINDPKLWDSQPSISPDGKTLYFATFRDSVNQTSDIYVSKKNPTTGKWGKATPLPSTINTLGNEKTPFMHPDNKTFYFSSDQLDGLGGYDIYMTKLKEDGSWSTPVNIGYPINTEANELGFFVSTNGKKGYFASDNLKGVGGFDIYEFDLPEKVRPEKVLFIKGEVEGEKSALSSAKVELKSTKSKEIVELNYDTITGKYASVVAFEEDFILTVKKTGFAYNSAYFSTEDSSLTDPQKVNLELKQSVVGSAYKLNNILYETSSADLNLQDKNILNDFAEYLSMNSTIKVSIQGHTDDEGNDIDNLKLSENRAKSVFDYLSSNGINKLRLTYKGFGETKPIADNSTEAGRKLNRRTEFVILSK